MGLICGWCGNGTRSATRCDRCGHADPARPFVQRGEEQPDESALRRRRLRLAEAAIRAEGVEPTAERIAERLDLSPRTVRRWREMSA